MIGSNILVDTNIVIELFKGHPSITKTLSGYSVINIPFAVLGELYLGVERSSHPSKHLKQVNDFLAKCNVINGDKETANNYAAIEAALLTKGKPIPENDIWIVAIAGHYQLKLITRDKHFSEIAELLIEN